MPDATFVKIIDLARDIARHAAELGQIGGEAALVGEGLDTEGDPGEAGVDTLSRQTLLSRCETIYRLRRHREAMFGGRDLFADPAWDIFLDLFIAHLRGRRISVTSACQAAHVPQTTALRWLSILESEGLIAREKDTSDSRRFFVVLTPVTISKMTKLLSE